MNSEELRISNEKKKVGGGSACMITLGLSETSDYHKVKEE